MDLRYANQRPRLNYCNKASQKVGLTKQFESKKSHKEQSFQEFFTSKEPDIHQMWAKIECPEQNHLFPHSRTHLRAPDKRGY